MLKLLKISITGDLSSGKTEACQIFQELGAYVISADKVSRSFLIPNSHIGHRVTALLGPEVIVANAFDRKAIAEKVFSDVSLLKALEAILHPEVCRVIEEQYNRVSQEGKYPLFIAEVPLLYEIHYAEWFDRVILIIADRDIRRERFAKKTNYSDSHFYQRCSRFSSEEEKLRHADIVIENNGTKEELRRKVEEYFYALKGAL
ncbi:dephospho-CoA kinase [Chlamydia gallinacea]|uniref:Dephospho-CoA kinase n=2 Tax=Chlamydia gallinacea TaxID=1457153 RepID=A0A173DZ43_9CHLA|nr:dephospho-CoA kinase [Chlamydia gallinacea]ANG66201.1 dephospho-CoA kinase [Chlamydia gallinacea 08-1274/3]EYE60492.1 dephospho-CoA kinase [Bacteroides fragilis str. S6L5]MBX6680474.1 dephospho-CoA kinase [Chlamydia gallinacea]MBX6687738.1 dephospho-CoA kinase [Chlamydia gallinacea]